ncbi:hypothetical protein [Psychrobium sp. 1_MG-2023]|uniref:hypothetical protein n=1 Tax=Psychrobium sp. 1_MG-2023 TaxID=3062624 RepID=UPI000C34AB04|nr:hypothetical protein [Psychrobium sp. 1_MG-2023]MDP2559542.1 hypothetical protein [Psychrobium sp. 1_MG-2023]PKF59381.1 hypothetical protein CW748_00990 [Alteromonadales bacterium alter-6D02]
MPLPLILLGTALSSVALYSEQKSHLRKQDRQRFRPNNHDMGREPSELLPSKHLVRVMPGSVVCCEVYQAFQHTGIVVDDDTIIELHGSGLIRAVSFKRFLHGRSGKNIFIACDRRAQPIVVNQAIGAAVNDIFTFHRYDLFTANCYRHTWRWLTGLDREISSFEQFNRLLSAQAKQPIYWDRAHLPSRLNHL